MSTEDIRPLVDGIGLMGNLFESALVIALGSSTILVFLYLWKKGLLAYDEEAAKEMMKHDETHLEK